MKQGEAKTGSLPVLARETPSESQRQENAIPQQNMNPFGVKTWNDVRDTITALIKRKWGGMPALDIEDAVSEAMVDLFEYWVGLPSSISAEDTGRNFAFATRRGVWTATAVLVKVHNEYGNRVKLEDYGDGHMAATPLIHGGVQTVSNGRAQEAFRDDETPEDVLIAQADRDALRFAIADLTDEERDKWFDAFASGLTTREAAALEKVDHSAVVRRRRAGMRRIAAKVSA